MDFKLVSDYKPAGDQGEAIKKLTDGYVRHANQTLLGVTGSGKTFTIANVIQNLQLPTLVLAHNKTLAAQLYGEFKNFFPENKVCYFVSYYDYYQPESYLPQTDTYIEKETMVNEKIEQLRLETASALATRKDVIVVSSVSCIYGFGSPIDFQKSIVNIQVEDRMSRKELLTKLIELLYKRNDIELTAGTFRVRGDVIDIVQGFGGDVTRIEFFGDEIERMSILDPITFDVLSNVASVALFPAKPFMAPQDKRIRAITSIREELKAHLPGLGLLEAHRLEQRTQYDLEMLEELGYCKGIENYSRHFEGRNPGEPPYCLLDFFNNNPFSKDFLMVIDESHVSVPQVRGMYFGDYTRKKNLVDYGFRLPSALDNRPLKFQEFQTYMKHVIFTTATPAEYELSTSGQVVQQVVRPTGLVDPHCFVRPIKGHIEDLTREIGETTKCGDRVLVTTLTKRSAEDLAEYLVQHDIKARYLHSEIDTLDRSVILKQLRLGVFDVLVGINLLREGLDLPEVGLVAILDADKEGFLR
ncbi:MAG: excinuclease ABC subunit UvrB, partial [bacterium]|nr:excinuclease ABC subunit UvrB [bacterium]